MYQVKWMAIVLVFAAGLLGSCAPAGPYRSRTLYAFAPEYHHDYRTGLCFVMSQVYGGAVVSHVPCTVGVMAIIPEAEK